MPLLDIQNLWGSTANSARYALRSLRRSPMFALTAAVTLVIGMAACTAIFIVVHGVLLRALPVPHPEELALLTDPDSHGSEFGGEGGERSLLAYSEFQYLHDHNEAFSKVFAADSQLPEVDITINNSSAGGGAQKETARVRLVSGETACVRLSVLACWRNRPPAPEVERSQRTDPSAGRAAWRSERSAGSDRS